MLGAFRTRSIPLVTLIAGVAAAVGFSVGPAQAQVPPARTSATALIVNGNRIAPADCPPGTGPVSAPGTSVGVLTVGLLTASCDEASATASAADVNIAGFNLGVLTTACTTGPGGTTTGAVIDPAVLGPLNLALTALGITIVTNEVVATADSRTINALHISGAGLDVIVAQSMCSTAAEYPLSAPAGQTEFAAKASSSLDPASQGTPGWLVVAAALALLAAVNVVFVGGVAARRRSSGR